MIAKERYRIVHIHKLYLQQIHRHMVQVRKVLAISTDKWWLFDFIYDKIKNELLLCEFNLNENQDYKRRIKMQLCICTAPCKV
jgi:hypothetical protein